MTIQPSTQKSTQSPVSVHSSKFWFGAIFSVIASLGMARAEVEDSKGQVSKFAEDVTLHVLIHELGHALIREFDIPILGNEETMADAFATHYLTTHLPDRAPDILKARAASLMIEAREVSRESWSVGGEHNNDARRAHQIAALAVAADPEKYRAVAKVIGMSEDDINESQDYGTEIHRSWRRVLQPLWMPDDLISSEVSVRYDPSSKIVDQLRACGLTKQFESIVRRFDWHSQITLNFAQGDGRAAWNRSKRAITIYSDYVRRFIEQGKIAGETEKAIRSEKETAE